MLEERFGWKGPKSGEQGSYDYLPLVVQADPQDEPELFDMPVECVPHVHIHHPKYPDLSLLDLRWYPIPAVCALDLTLGGIVYTAVPFNGWYADTEVLRDLIDEDRYDLLVPIAQALGIYEETKPGEAPYYKDEVILILSKAIHYSFKTAKVAMIVSIVNNLCISYRMCKCTNDLSIISLSLPSLSHNISRITTISLICFGTGTRAKCSQGSIVQ